MADVTNAPAGRLLQAGEYWYEDLEPGDHFATSGVTVTEAHVVGFAGLVGDLFDVHMDEEFAREQGFPGRIAHGLLGLALADGLKTRCPVRLMGIATLNWSWAFRGPILIGDRIRATLRIETRRLTARGDRGIVSLGIEVLNQSGKVVQDGRSDLLMRRRPAAAG